MADYICTTCKQPFSRPPSWVKNKETPYCSRNCAGTNHRIETPCAWCGKMFYVAGQKATCSPDCTRRNRMRSLASQETGFPNQLHRIRMEKGMTFRDIEEATGGRVNASNISAYERTNLKLSEYTLRLVAEALGVKPEDIGTAQEYVGGHHRSSGYGVGRRMGKALWR